MPDPDDEVPIMQRFDRLMKAMVRPAPSGKIEGEDRTSDAERMMVGEQDIRDRLLAFYEPDEVELWMCAPHPLLGFRTALQEIREGQCHKVERLIAQLEDGVYI